MKRHKNIGAVLSWIIERLGKPYRVSSHSRGWEIWSMQYRFLGKIYWTNTWRYADTGELFDTEKMDFRPCKRCGYGPTPEGYDACLGKIDGAKSACCGHGVVGGFIYYKDGREAKIGGLNEGNQV